MLKKCIRINRYRIKLLRKITMLRSLLIRRCHLLLLSTILQLINLLLLMQIFSSLRSRDIPSLNSIINHSISYLLSYSDILMPIVSLFLRRKEKKKVFWNINSTIWFLFAMKSFQDLTISGTFSFSFPTATIKCFSWLMKMEKWLTVT